MAARRSKEPGGGGRGGGGGGGGGGAGLLPPPTQPQPQGQGHSHDKSCVLCCQELEVYALGKCDHSVCYRCSTKMRVLCEQKYCAVCRLELDKVVFVKKLAPFATIMTHQFHHEKKYDIYIADGRILAQFRQLLQHKCPICVEARPLNSFEELEQHMRKQHEMFSCKLCAKHLQIFTYERKWYSRKDLARHRIHGDPDDTSHRGHPLCKFCDDRYLDNDELLKHLRRDHYFCHFCDSDGAQEYYSDYDYLRDHFREKHYLCEEGRCSTEQFTHAFRTEIDYKAHKAACHSKNRAEARQNRQIDLQFNYASRHQRRNEGLVSGEDYDEVDRFNRRGGPPQNRGQNRRGRWKYNREEEDRDVAAAVRASIAARRQEEKKQAASKEESETSKSTKDDKETDDAFSAKNVTRPPSETIGNKEATKGPSKEETKTLCSTAPLKQSNLAAVRLNEEEFPSLSASATSAPPGLTPAYVSTSKKNTPFQEEDFPALVSKIKQNKPSPSVSAWTSAPGKNVLKVVHPSSINSNRAVKKPLPINSNKTSVKNKLPSRSEEVEDDTDGLTAQEFRSTPTMLDISSLLTTSTQTISKVGKKKKVGGEKPSSSPPLPVTDPVVSKAQKENVPDTKPDNVLVTSVLNGHTDKLCTETPSLRPLKEPPGFKTVHDLCPLPEEDFPALGNPVLPKKPPPGFNSLLAVKSPPSNLPPPPGLSAPVSKPPPGFTGVPLNSNISEPVIPAPKQPAPALSGTYLIPENFQQRNIDLINSINQYLYNDEAKFSKFRTQSGQFRQGQISAAEYYRGCRELLGENFKKILNELLVLLPDTGKQQELLTAHNDLRLQEKQGSNKSKKNKKNAWQSGVNSELDCQVCPTCQQVLTPKDFLLHKTLHFEDDEFPTLQSVSRIIS